MKLTKNKLFTTIIVVLLIAAIAIWYFAATASKDTSDSTDQRTDPNGQPVGTGSPHSQTAEQLLAKLKVGKLQ